MIDVQHLTKKFGGVIAVDDLTLRREPLLAKPTSDEEILAGKRSFGLQQTQLAGTRDSFGPTLNL